MNKLQAFPPPVVALLLLGLAHISRKLFSLEVLPATSTGLVWTAVGLALGFSAAWQFRQIKTTTMPQGTPTELVTLGAYLWTRNPMYLGLLTALTGIALYEGVLAFWLTPIAFFVIINSYHIPYEEAKLTALFSGKYLSYCQQVRRWL